MVASPKTVETVLREDLAQELYPPLHRILRKAAVRCQHIEAMNAARDFIQIHRDAFIDQCARVDIPLIMQQIELRRFNIRRRQVRDVSFDGRRVTWNPAGYRVSEIRFGDCHDGCILEGRHI